MSCYFNPDKKLENIALEAEEAASEAFDRIEHTARCNSEKVLKAFIDNRVGDMHLKGTTGYGYGDRGRDALDEIFAENISDDLSRLDLDPVASVILDDLSHVVAV